MTGAAVVFGAEVVVTTPAHISGQKHRIVGSISDRQSSLLNILPHCSSSDVGHPIVVNVNRKFKNIVVVICISITGADLEMIF